MHAVTGIYTPTIFITELGLSPTSLLNNTPKPDFNGVHADPNLHYAKDLFTTVKQNKIDIGLAFDGDGDRCFIVSKDIYITPSDTIAVIADRHKEIPYFINNGFNGVSRSCPTSRAVERVMKGKNCYMNPVGWKFFQNLMDAKMISLCGEEAFGFGCDGIREKDGVFGALCWFTFLAQESLRRNRKVDMLEVMNDHWSRFGRNYYVRFFWEDVELDGAVLLIENLRRVVVEKSFDALRVKYNLEELNAFEYSFKDLVDGAVYEKQGLIFESVNQRIVVRLSGTGAVGATVRFYIEQFAVEF